MSFYVQFVGESSQTRIQIPDCLPSTQWAHAKHKVSELLHFPLEACRFIHKGKILENGMGTLHQCQIKRGDVVLVQQILGHDHIASQDRIDLHSEASPAADEQTELTVASFECDTCLRRKSRKTCRTCGCHKCGIKDDSQENIVCDECNLWFHWSCLDPPLSSLPDGDWYCSQCKNDTTSVITPGSHSKVTSDVTTNEKVRKWGTGMANVGHTKSCTIVPPTHRGPIPGIEVGQTWKYRVQCGEDGVHRPPVAGIAGSAASAGAVSIVLSNGYPEDVDNGDTFIYTGSGGRTRTSKPGSRIGYQSCDQELIGPNLHLAQTCDAPVSKDGAVAADWQKSRAIRVVRSQKVHQPKYAPSEGYRYDGIYKLVKYYQQGGYSGYRIYRFEFRRDDTCPPPWTIEGAKRIAKLGLEMVYPASSKVNERQPKEASNVQINTPTHSRGLKRRFEGTESDLHIKYKAHNDGLRPKEGRSSRHEPLHADRAQNPESSPQKLRADETMSKDIESSLSTEHGKDETSRWTIPQGLQDLIVAAIRARPAQKSLYTKVQEGSFRNIRDFVNHLERELECPICKEFVQRPVASSCGHISCLSCLRSCVESDFGPRCPLCRADLIEDKLAGVDLQNKDVDVRWKGSMKIDAELVEVIRYCVPTYCQDPSSSF